MILARVLGLKPFEFFDAEVRDDEEVELTARVQFPKSAPDRE